ncbi:MAG: recombination protein NinG [Candidatus Paceibacterota bacterium]|jgi:hypothetical protein
MIYSKADKYFSLWIRLRDADEYGYAKCCTCNAHHPVKSMDCGHFIKRQHMATRFSEMNGNVQCKNCNAFEQGRNEVYEKFLVKKYGQDKVDLLKMQGNSTRKISKFELDQIAKYYKSEAEKLAKVKQIKIW